ncbi:MAG: large subunit ribosomal protein L10 [Cyclobacteriaceae bacterium]|jgi:large subunit ribosomal protein L10
MTREDKAILIADLTEKFQHTEHFYITDTSGLTVAEINKFREACFKKGVEYRVVKNTLIKKALLNLETDYSEMDSALKGFSGVMFINENAKVPAEVIKDYQKADPKDRPTFKAASINADIYVGSEHLDMLMKLKSREELIGEIINLLQSPAKNVIGALQSGGHKLAGILKTLSERE